MFCPRPPQRSRRSKPLPPDPADSSLTGVRFLSSPSLLLASCSLPGVSGSSRSFSFSSATSFLFLGGPPGGSGGLATPDPPAKLASPSLSSARSVKAPAQSLRCPSPTPKSLSASDFQKSLHSGKCTATSTQREGSWPSTTTTMHRSSLKPTLREKSWLMSLYFRGRKNIYKWPLKMGLCKWVTRVSSPLFLVEFQPYSGWWFQPIPKILVKLDHFPQTFGVKIKNIWVATT